VEELLNVLENLLETYKENWTQAFSLMLVILLACRLIEFGGNRSDSSRRAIQLLLKCRETALDWIERIDLLKAKETPKKGLELFQRNLLDVALCLCNTYDVTNAETVVKSGEDFVSWMLGINRIYNIVNTSADLELTTNRRLLIRKVQNVALRIEPILTKFKDAGLTEYTMTKLSS